MVSGFLSETDDANTSWMGALQRDPSKQFYNLRWRANSTGKIANSVLGKIGGNIGQWLLNGVVLGSALNLARNAVLWSMDGCR